MERAWIFLSASIFAGTLPGQTPGTMPVASQRALVDKYCAGCHNDKLKTGGFSFTQIDLAHPNLSGEQAEKVIRKLRAGMMPPAGLPRPDVATTRTFAASVEAGIDKAAAINIMPGSPDLHRLNRTEYRNSARDLLNLDVDVTTMLPPDDSSHGFDNMADALSVTPALMQGYVRAAGKIARAAIGDTNVAPSQAMYNVTKLVNQMRHVDGAPLGTRGGTSVIHNFPADGEYTFKALLVYWYTEQLFGSNLPKPVEGQQVEISIDGNRVGLFDIQPATTETKANYVTAPIKVTAGPHRVSAAFPMKFDGPIVDTYRMEEQTLVDVSTGLQPGMTTLPHLQSLVITGPLKVSGVSDTPSRKKIFSCRPANAGEEIPCARKIITTLAKQAYRRPVTDNDIEELLTDFQQGRNEGGDFDTGIRMVIQGILVNPEFAFRFEHVPSNVASGANYRISDLELASRLSYFLWSSAPDEELLTVASQGRLKDRAVLERQVRRMLLDPRAETLATNFAYQWLHLQSLKDVDPDGLMFPNFTRQVADAMVRETELMFENIMRQDKSPAELLDANYTFVNETLARHYGIPNVSGDRFQRVALTDPNRFGILGQGSFLTLTSQANRTSPVTRGKYVMETLLGTPPPAPPPNVPALKENSNPNEKQLSVRERMEQHRANEPCRSCHQMMDPIGMSLENFDPVGVWRINDSGFKVNPTSQLYDGTKLDGPVSLRNAILTHQDAYMGNFTENLLAYGIGRVLDYHDMTTVRAIEHEAASHNNQFSSFVLGVVESAPFRMRSADRPLTTNANDNNKVASR